MRNKLFKPAIFVSILAIALVAILARPGVAEAADRYYVGSGSDWNTDANWSASSGGAGGASFPVDGDAVYFDANSGNCTLDAAAEATSIDLTNYAGKLTDAGYTVTVNGNITIPNVANKLTSSGTWIMGANGNLEVQGNSNRLYRFQVAEGVTTTRTVGSSSVRGLIMETNSTLQGSLALSIYPDANDFLDMDLTGGSEATITGGQITIIPGSADYTNKAIDLDTNMQIAYGYGTIQMTGDWAMSGRFWMYGSYLSVSEATAQILDTNGHNLTVNSDLWLGPFSGANYEAKILFSSGTHNITGDLETFIIDSYCYIEGGSATISVGEDIDLTYITFTAGTSTVTLNGDSDQTITSNSQSFYNLTLNNTTASPNDDIILADALDVDNNLTITDGDLNGNNQNITVGKDWDNSGSGSYTAGTETVTFDTAANTTTIKGDTTFYNLTCATAGKTITFTDGTTQTIESGGVLTLTGSSGSLITLGGSSTAGWDITDSGTESVSYVDVSYSTAANGITAATSKDSDNNTNWTFSASSLTWDGSTDTDWDTAANWDLGYVPNDTDNITIADVTNDPVLGSATTTNNLTINSGAVLSLNGQNLTVSSTYSNAGTLKLNGDETTVSLTNDSNSGLTKFVKSTGTITIKDLSAYWNLEFDSNDGGDGTAVFVLPAAIDVNNNLTITDGSLDVDNSGNYQINAAGSWNNSGTLTPRSGTVVFDGTNQDIDGSTTFYNFSKTESSDDSTDETLTFDNTATQTIGGLLTLDGRDSNDRINLVSNSPGTAWELVANGTFAVKAPRAEPVASFTNTNSLESKIQSNLT